MELNRAGEGSGDLCCIYFPDISVTSPMSGGTCPFVLFYLLHTHPYADKVLTVLPPSTLIKTHSDSVLTGELQMKILYGEIYNM